MQPGHLIIFAVSRPFERFRVYVADGRQIEVNHPEIVPVAEHGLGLWLLHAVGQVAMIAGDAITGLRTLGSVDASQFIPRSDQK